MTTITQQDDLEDLAKAFAFLDGLRCLVEAFDMQPDEARKVWSLWANTFALDTAPEERAATALAARPH
jgi:hypothetical protein